FGDPAISVLLVALLVIVSLLSGFYPSVVLSGFKPVEAIKNKISSGNAGTYTLRRGLVVLQFVISQILIIGTIVVTSQLQYFKNKDLGFKKEAVVTFPLPENERNQLTALKDRLNSSNDIKKVTFAL